MAPNVQNTVLLSIWFLVIIVNLPRISHLETPWLWPGRRGRGGGVNDKRNDAPTVAAAARPEHVG